MPHFAEGGDGDPTIQGKVSNEKAKHEIGSGYRFNPVRFRSRTNAGYG